MGLTVGGFALLVIVVLVILTPGARGRLVFAAIIGAMLPVAAQVGAGAGTISTSLAPLLNAVAGGLG